MQVRGKSNMVALLGIIVVSVVLALLGAMLLTQASSKKAIPLKSPIQVREDEIGYLEKLLEEDIAEARQEGKGEADIAAMKAKYSLSIDKLKTEIETLKAGGQVDTP